MKSQDWEPGIAFFVTPHGLGHAARSVAIMAALREAAPRLRMDVFTTVPESFFRESVPDGLFWHPLVTDIGLVQDSPLHADLPCTLEALDRFLPFDPELVGHVAVQVRTLDSRLIVCDIAPLGVAVAERCGIPSVLVENFTWDWIYEGYLEEWPTLQPHISYLREWFRRASYHIQTEPVSLPSTPDLTVAPVCRRVRTEASLMRAKLGLPAGIKAVLVTMGGIPDLCHFADQLAEWDPIHFVIPIGDAPATSPANVRFLVHGGGFYHPDVVNACDAVVAKLGYSTLAEVWQAGVPMATIQRPGFREGEVLGRFVQECMSHVTLSAPDFSSGAWLRRLSELLSFPRQNRITRNGAEAAAGFLLARTGQKSGRRHTV